MLIFVYSQRAKLSCHTGSRCMLFAGQVMKISYPPVVQRVVTTYHFPGGSWKRWPDGDYSIPMSIYGCPEQEINNWIHSFINITLTAQTTIHYIKGAVEDEYITWQAHDFLLLGPYGSNTVQMNFCSKLSISGKLKGVEWPRGLYAVYSNDRNSCPEGK